MLNACEIEIWNALIDLGTRTSIGEIALYVNRAHRTTRARVEALHKFGFFEYGETTSKHTGGQGFRSYVLRCVPEAIDKVRMPAQLLAKLVTRKRPGRPKKNSVCANEIKITEQINTWLLF